MKRSEISDFTKEFNKMSTAQRVHRLMCFRAEWLNKYWCPCEDPVLLESGYHHRRDLTAYKYITDNYSDAIGYIFDQIKYYMTVSNIGLDSFEEESKAVSLYSNFMKVARYLNAPLLNIMPNAEFPRYWEYKIPSTELLSREYIAWNDFDMDKMGEMCFKSIELDGSTFKTMIRLTAPFNQIKYARCGTITIGNPDFRKLALRKFKTKKMMMSNDLVEDIAMALASFITEDSVLEDGLAYGSKFDEASGITYIHLKSSKEIKLNNYFLEHLLLFGIVIRFANPEKVIGIVSDALIKNPITFDLKNTDGTETKYIIG